MHEKEVGFSGFFLFYRPNGNDSGFYHRAGGQLIPLRPLSGNKGKS